MKHWSVPTKHRILFYFFSLCFCLFFPHFSQEGFVHQHKPGSDHPGRPRGRVMLVWETVRARPGAVQGESAACLWLTSGRCGADPCSTGSFFHLWEPEHSVSEGRVSEPQFNKPSAAPVPIPRNLINAVRWHGSALLRPRAGVASPSSAPQMPSKSSIH